MSEVIYGGIERIYRLRRKISSCTLLTQLNISKMIPVSTAGYNNNNNYYYYYYYYY
jgi:hypothetical protein